MTATASIRDIRTDIRNDDLAYDPWGTAMAWWFAISRVVNATDSPPEDWGYVPAPGQAGESLADINYSDDYPDCWVAEQYGQEPAALIYWGDILRRYTALLKRHEGERG